MKRTLLRIFILVLLNVLALAAGAWTTFQHLMSVLAFGISGPEAFFIRVSDSFEGAVYPSLAFWDLMFLIVLGCLAWFCRRRKQRMVLFMVAITPAAIAHISAAAVMALSQPASFWLLTLAVQMGLAAAALGGLGSLFPPRGTSCEGTA